MQWEQAHDLVGKLSQAQSDLEIAVRLNHKVLEATDRFNAALKAVQPLADLLRPGETISAMHVVILRPLHGTPIALPVATSHDLADRFNAANPVPAPEADPGIEYVPAQYAGEPEYVDRFHE